MLGRREHSRDELRLKLLLRGFQDLDVDRILDRLEAENLLNSGRFAAQYVQSRTARGFGPRKILRELLDRGVERVQAEDAVQAWPGDWDSLLADVYRKRYGNTVATSEAERAKRLRYLNQRGFGMNRIDKLLFASKSMTRVRVD